MRPGTAKTRAVRARDLRSAGPQCQAIVGPSHSVFERSGHRFAIRKRVRTKNWANYAPCWRAREACDCSARMRSASVPPPPSGGALGAAVLALAGFGAALGGVEG